MKFHELIKLHGSIKLRELIKYHELIKFLIVSVSGTPPAVSHKRGRPRGRPRGAGTGRPRGAATGRRPRGRGSVQKALIAAEMAAQNAGKAAAYAAYGYSFTGAFLMRDN